jgi:hypothetical protein
MGMTLIVKKLLGYLVHKVGRRGAFLAFLALLDWIYGYALAFPTPAALANPTYKFLIQSLPLNLWAGLWFGVGTICFVYAFRKRDAPGYAAAMFLKILWSALFLFGWVFAGVERGYLSSAIWGAFAAILALIATWPEPEPGKGHIGPIRRGE